MADRTDLNSVPEIEEPAFSQIEIVDGDGQSRTVDVNDENALKSVAAENDIVQQAINPQAPTQPTQESPDAPLFGENTPSQSPDAPLFGGENAPNTPPAPDMTAILNPVLDKITQLTETIAAGSQKDEVAEELALLDKAEQGWQARMAKALEGKDYMAQSQAQAKLMEISQRRIAAETKQAENKNKPQEKPAETTGAGETKLTPAGQAWVAKQANWFKQPGFENQTVAAIEEAEKLAGAGYDPAKPEFYTAVENRLKQRFKPNTQQTTATGGGANVTSPTQPTANRTPGNAPKLASPHMRIIQDMGINPNTKEGQAKVNAIAQSFDARLKRNHPTGR